MGILTRYVLAELAKVFLVSLTALTGLMLIVGVVREATMQSLPLVQVVRLLPYILPDALRVSVPVTLLLATTSVYGRMSGLNEIVAAKALGISPMVLLRPTYMAAFLLSLVTVWLNDVAVSWGRNGVQRVVVEAVEDIVYAMLRAQHSYSSPQFAINVKRVEGRRLIRVTLTIQPHDNSPGMTIAAEEAELVSDPGEGVLRIILRKGSLDIGGKVVVQFPDVYEQDIPLRDASRTANSSLPASWLPLCLIGEQVAQQKAGIERCEQEMALQAGYQMISGDFQGLTGRPWKTLAQERQYRYQQLHRLQTEPHRRWSAGFSCLCFAWVGAPMAIRRRHRDFVTSFFLCFVPILIVYYPLLMYGVDGAKNGTIPPYAVWVGNLLLLAWGAWLLKRVIRY